MAPDTLTAPLSDTDLSQRLALRALRHFKAQVEDWYDDCRALAEWEDDHLLDEPSEKALADHACLLDQLERVGRWLFSATQSADFPDHSTARLVEMTLRDLKDVRALWHGRDLDENRRREILKSCFDEP